MKPVRDLKIGDELWCFTTRGCEWYGAYSTDWIELMCIKAKPRMCNGLLDVDPNMYFKSKDEAVDALSKQLDKIKEMKFHKPDDFK